MRKTCNAVNGVQTLQILWKSRKGYAPAERLYSTFWSNLSKKFQFWGSYTLIVAPIGVKFGMEEGPMQRVAPAGLKPSNRHLSNLNTGALRCGQCCRPCYESAKNWHENANVFSTWLGPTCVSTAPTSILPATPRSVWHVVSKLRHPHNRKYITYSTVVRGWQSHGRR